MGIPTLTTFFRNNAYVHISLSEDGTAIKSGATKSHLVWDPRNKKRHFMHGSSQMTEIYLYVGHGYFNVFCIHIHKILGDKVQYTFSLAYFIDPNTNVELPSNTQVITHEEGYQDEK